MTPALPPAIMQGVTISCRSKRLFAEKVALRAVDGATHWMEKPRSEKEVRAESGAGGQDRAELALGVRLADDELHTRASSGREKGNKGEADEVLPW